MHAPFDRSGKTPFDRFDKGEQSSFLKNTVVLLMLPVLITVALVALTLVHPKSSMWISQAVQAEFGGSGIAVDMPTEVAQPATLPQPMPVSGTFRTQATNRD